MYALLTYSVSCDLPAAPAPTDLDQPQLTWTGTSLGPVYIDSLMVFTGRFRIQTQAETIEIRYGPAQTGSGWSRCRGDITRNAVNLAYSI